MTETKAKRIGWTKIERIERTGRDFKTYSAGSATAGASCYLCGAVIGFRDWYMAGDIQVRAYRSAADIGATRGRVRVCAACIFQGPPVAGIY